MYNILGIGRSGLNAMQNKLDGVADNLANINTHGYKRKEIGFQELLTNRIDESQVLRSDNLGHARINAGSRSGLATINFVQGILKPSEGKYHMAIEGSGFFGVRDEDGNLMLTRNGGFHMDGNLRISDDSGYFLDIDYALAPEEWGQGEISISANGEISQMADGESMALGRVILYNPDIVDSLIPLGEGRYLPSPNVPLFNSLNHNEGFGDIHQGFVEESNVDMSRSMTDLIQTQRAYSFNSKLVQNTDDLMYMVNNLKR